ncbi:NIPSNAP family protein [Neisseria shayeganii]|uniref:Nipsnap superfamily protein n=1 Tax=Neisseria shayeganii 871 TaxID=1032488 RepID=G4CKX5_9NEIS|nr:NIPSNAP family protein [Neisseria shayeganii]EGY51540.1 nipsnap superfamily protein [Neisseria shayeganii 871]
MQKLVEIRSYRLQPGSGAEFERVVREESAPLHAAFGIDVIAFGLSEHDADAFYLIRAFDDLAHLHSAQQAFYASPAWREGPREAIVSRILSDADAVMWLDETAVEALRRPCLPAA